VRFSREQIERIVIDFAKKGYFNNASYQHAVDIGGATLIECWFAGEEDKSHALGLQPKAGTFMGTYYVENPALKEAIKNKDVTGFSIEGWFDHVEVAMNSQPTDELAIVTEQDKAIAAHFEEKSVDPKDWLQRLGEILAKK
jgi:hypothetical protein